MKRIITTLIFLAIVAVAASVWADSLVSATPVTLQQTEGPPLPFDPNPYCGALPPPPEPGACPPGSIHDLDCLTACFDAWESSVQATFDFACGEYGRLTDQYAAIVHNYDLALQQCLAEHPASQDPIGREQCWIDHNASCASARSLIATLINGLNDIVYQAVDDADAAFYSCADACCIHPPRKDR
jgi:hypothetical protein